MFNNFSSVNTKVSQVTEFHYMVDLQHSTPAFLCRSYKYGPFLSRLYRKKMFREKNMLDMAIGYGKFKLVYNSLFLARKDISTICLASLGYISWFAGFLVRKKWVFRLDTKRGTIYGCLPTRSVIFRSGISCFL